VFLTVLQVSWFQDSFPVERTERRFLDSKENKHYLTIKRVQSQDFGNYSCVADNSLGRAKKYIELSGLFQNPTLVALTF